METDETDVFVHRLKELTDEEKRHLKAQNSRLIPEAKAQRLEREAKRHWDIFYKRNETKFFRDRHWTTREFQELINFDSEQKTVFLELGCGVGNMLFPLVEEGFDNFYFYACDFSPRAVEFVKNNKLYDPSKMTAFCADLTTDELFENVPESSVDIASLIFVLSAIQPACWARVAKNAFKVLRPGGTLLFRDYGRYDMAQLRFKPGHKIAENFYMRQDGTRSYYFTEDELATLFTDAGFEVLANSYVQRRTVNFKDGVDVPRIFVQGKYRKTEGTMASLERGPPLVPAGGNCWNKKLVIGVYRCVYDQPWTRKPHSRDHQKMNMGQEMGRSDETRETFIFYTTKKVTEPCEEMGLDIYSAKYPKCVNYCPRCKEMMHRIETLFMNSPSNLDTEFCELFSCRPCTDIVHKFRKFTAEDFLFKEVDSELIHLQRLTSPGDDDAFGKARTKFENLVKASASQGSGIQNGEQINKEGAGRIKKETTDEKDAKKKVTGHGKDKVLKKKETGHEKDKDLKKKETGHEKDKDLKKKETAHEKELKTKTSKVMESLGKGSKEATATLKERASVGDLKTKSTEYQKTLGKGSKDKARKISDSRTRQLVSKSKLGRSSVDIKNKKDKHDVDKGGKGENAGNWAYHGKPQIREKIDEHMKQKLQQERVLEKSRKDAENKLNKAAKMEEQAHSARAKAEEARQMKFRQAFMMGAGPQTKETASGLTDICSEDTADDHIIIGDRIFKASKERGRKHEAGVAVTELPPPPPPTNTDKITPVTDVSTAIRDKMTTMIHPLITEHKAGITLPKKRHALDMDNKTFNYLLSDRKFIENGWTKLPKEMVMQRVILFHMYTPRNDFDWLEMNRHKGRVLYDTGEQLATFDENRRARVYYKSGVVALDFYQAEDALAGGYRVVVYSTGSPSESRALPTVLAVFDYSGNGAVFDHTGQPRLKYSQNDGVVLDRSIGPYTHWRWHNLNDSGHFQTVLIDNEPLVKDQEIIRIAEQQLVQDKKSHRKGGSGSSRPGSHADKSSKKGGSPSDSSRDKSSSKTVRIETGSGEKSPSVVPEQGTVASFVDDETLMNSIEAQNMIKENNMKRFLPYQIKLKAFKINENFSLRIIDQSTVYLTFTDGKTRMKLNVGMIIDPDVVVGQDLVQVGEVTSTIERVAASESVQQLQRVVKGARAAERARILREHRLNPPVSSDLTLVKNKQRKN